jgi:hypothetical protein
MSLVFMFWLNALYTLVLFGVQVRTLVHPAHPVLQVAVLNAFYLALLSAYVGGKEVVRWKEGQTPKAGRPLWLRGEWFVGLWAIFLLAAVLLSQIWPQRFVYPEAATLIAFEILGFYVGSSASAWLHRLQDKGDHGTLEATLEGQPISGKPAPAVTARVSRKRQRYEAEVLEMASGPDGVTREQTQKRLSLSRAAAGKLLNDLVDQGKLRRDGDFGDVRTRYLRN